MNILHINRNYTTSSLHEVMLAHLEKYDDIHSSVFSPVEASQSEWKNTLTRTDVCISSCLSRWDRFAFDWKQHKIRKSLEQNFDVQKFDCIHAYTLFTDGNCAMNLSEKYGIPYVVAVRNTDVNSFFKRLPYLRGRGVRIMEKASAIFFLSEAYQDRVFSQYIPEEKRELLKAKTHVVPNGIDDFWLENRFTEKRELHDLIRLVYAGRIDKNKNIEKTVEAVEELKHRGVKAELTVVGKVQDQEIYERISRYDFVNYHEAVPKERLIDFYRESDIFVMPSYKETFGLVYAEAMSQGLPVIYTKGEGFDGQFPEGEVGYHVDARSVASVASGITDIINNYESITQNLTERVGQFSWELICERYVKIYQKIVKRK